jgi:diacylglycerol O-acyltransferase / wax synthase
VPPLVLGIVSRTAIRSMQRFGQQSLNTVTTNVPGPQVPPSCMGRALEEYRPFVPISHGLRVGTAILSYNGRLFFGITGDFRSTPEVAVLADATAAGVEDLRDRALEALGDHRPG